MTDIANAAAHWLTQGGDARILVSGPGGRNRYHSSPSPVDTLAYASSTANDVSRGGFARACDVLGLLAPAGELIADDYARALETLRARIRAAFALDDTTDIVFAPSGTDLEYVGLALAKGRAEGGISNILLGADEVGSGCIHSARAQFFATSTARGVTVEPGAPIGGNLPRTVKLVDIPVRHANGAALASAEIAARIDDAVTAARKVDRHALVHIVHGSKTGLVLPSLVDVDALRARHGDHVSFVVDACQARITSAAIADYLARGITVFLTGSKFMGGPPFSGMALLPHGAAASAARLPVGFARIFRQAEWPAGWEGVSTLADEGNLGLLLRLEAAVFELERFQALPLETVTRVILAFHAAVRAAMVERLGGRRIAPYAPGLREEGDTHPIEMRTLSTIDISRLGGGLDFDASQRLHAALVEDDIRLGQPVKCVHLPDGRWGGTLRLGLSMPQVSDRAALDDAALASGFAADMDRIATVIERRLR